MRTQELAKNLKNLNLSDDVSQLLHSKINNMYFIAKLSGSKGEDLVFSLMSAPDCSFLYVCHESLKLLGIEDKLGKRNSSLYHLLHSDKDKQDLKTWVSSNNSTSTILLRLK
jgi:hypothetical protein